MGILLNTPLQENIATSRDLSYKLEKVNGISSLNGNVDVNEIYNSDKSQKLDGDGYLYSNLIRVATGGYIMFRDSAGTTSRLGHYQQVADVFAHVWSSNETTIIYYSNTGNIKINNTLFEGLALAGLNPRMDGVSIGEYSVDNMSFKHYPQGLEYMTSAKLLTENDVIYPSADSSASHKPADANAVGVELLNKRDMTERVQYVFESKFLPVTDPYHVYEISSYSIMRSAEAGYILLDANGANAGQINSDGVFYAGSLSLQFNGKTYQEWETLGTPVKLETFARMTDVANKFDKTGGIISGDIELMSTAASWSGFDPRLSVSQWPANVYMYYQGKIPPAFNYTEDDDNCFVTIIGQSAGNGLDGNFLVINSEYAQINEFKQYASTNALAPIVTIDPKKVAFLDDLEKKLNDNTATYSSRKTYNIGDFVKYDNELYVCKIAITSAETWNNDKWVSMRNVSSLFSNNNTSLISVVDSRIPYQFNDDGYTVKDHAINKITRRTALIPSAFTELVIRASGPVVLTMPSEITTTYGDPDPSEPGEYMITVTKIGMNEAYVRVTVLTPRS